MKEPEDDQFDAIVIGTGIGGATLGYALSQAGRSVLFLEQGLDLASPGTIRGRAPESVNEYACAGRNAEAWLDPLRGESYVPYIGAGSGGSSALYGMAMERRLPHDFDGWPVDSREFEPWYHKAELLYQVPGDDSALPRLSTANQVLFDHLRRRGLHPYRLHLACRRTPDCRICQGYLCDSPQPCKVDARTACLEPAVSHGARLITRAQVTHLEAKHRRVTAVCAEVQGEHRRFRGSIVALAAGALATPVLLQRSGNLANRSGLVGRRLMRHKIDLFVLSLAPRFRTAGEAKELGLHDFYDCPEPLGTVQSFGAAPPLDALRNRPGPNLWKRLGPVAAPIARAVADAPIMAGILADQPDPENRVEAAVDSGANRITYRLPKGDAARRKRLGARILAAFARFAPVPVFGTSDLPALGHACGTAVFGEDPQTSVLDRNCRAHDLENLYIVDASFFPTSGGVNPALTIAANALRVAAVL